jgi:RND superfamily putative drug exporter
MTAESRGRTPAAASPARESALARWARWVARHRWTVVALGLLIAAGASFLGGSGNYTGDFVASGEAKRTSQLLADELGRPGRSSFVVVFAATGARPDPARFRAAVNRALAPVRADPRVAGVLGPFDGVAGVDDAGVAADGRTAYATVSLRDDAQHAALYYRDLRGAIGADGVRTLGTGDVAVAADLGRSLDADLAKAELISFPLALLLLLLVFGTVVAAALPLVVGALAITTATACVAALSGVVDMSELTTSVVTLLGLGLAIDYSLFIVSRFRDELESGTGTEDALAVAVATAGRTVLVSGLAVVAGLSGLFVFRGSFLPGMGLGAVAAVLLSAGFGLTFLPALLAILGRRVNRWPVLRRRSGRSERFWRRLAAGVLRRPWLLLPVVAVLVVLGLPFLHARLETNDLSQLPAGTEARSGAQALAAAFPPFRTADVKVVVRFDRDPLSTPHVAALQALSRTISSLPGVTGIEGIIDPAARTAPATYAARYADPASLSADQRDLLRRTVGPHVVLLDVKTALPAGGPDAHRLVTSIRALPAPDARILVTGQAATEADLLGVIGRWTPWALAMVVLLTYVVLLLALRSVLLPAKAVVLTLLSITASFGALVWIFQDGHLYRLFGASPAGLDPAVPVLLFSLAFGLSMDYEVLLLSRIQEAYLAGSDNVGAVETGLARSGPLVTGAAAIMVAVFASFAVGQVVLVKAIGLGLALAVAVDATLVRCVAVPALMRLFGRANWWAPRPLRRSPQHMREETR